MLIAWLFVLFGVLFLYVGAEFLVRSAVQISLYFKLSRLLIGLTIVALATSIPEVITTIIGQLKGKTGDIAMGNVLGSNIANIGLILGGYLILRPCSVTHELKWQKIPTLLFVYAILFFIMLGGTINRIEGIFFLFLLLLYVLFQYLFPPKKAEVEEEIKIHNERPRVKIMGQLLLLIFSGGLLVLGAQSLIEGALKLAAFFGLSERIIGVSVIAFGTSLPELATAIVAAFRKEQEIIVGTVLGSNIFNPLLILPCATFVKPIAFSQLMLFIDFPLMVFFALLLWVLMLLGHDRLSRLDGCILVLAYFVYIIFLFV